MFDNNEIQSRAISQAFYLGSAKQTKDSIRRLIAGLRSQTEKGVYNYGVTLNAILVEALISHTSSVECSPLTYVGKFSSANGGSAMCGGGSEYTEERIREQISEQDYGVRKSK